MGKLLTLEEVKSKSEKIIDRVSKIKGIKYFDPVFKGDWSGYYRYYGYFFADYINYKYNNVCAHKDSYLRWDFLSLKLNNGLKDFEINKVSEPKTHLINFIRNCKKRFVILPITIYSHKNVIIYDTMLGEVELFDSYGGGFLAELSKHVVKEHIEIYEKNYVEYIKAIKDLFIEILGENKFKFFLPVDFFPTDKEFQNLEMQLCPNTNFKLNTSIGFCVAWSFWYAESRIDNPNIPRHKLVKSFLDLFTKEIKEIRSSKKNNVSDPENRAICKVIRGYTTFLLKLDSDKSFYQKNILFVKLHKDLYIRKLILYSILSFILAGYSYILYKLGR